MNTIEPAVSKALIQFHTMSAKGGGDSFRGGRDGNYRFFQKSGEAVISRMGFAHCTKNKNMV